MKSALRIVAVVGAMGLVTSAYAGTTTITPVLGGSVPGSFTFTGPGTEDFDFTIPTPYRYDFTLSAGLFSTTTSGGPGSYVVAVTATGAGTVDYTLTTAVPEPMTWAMMLLGFAGLGVVGYGRRSSSSRKFGASGDVGVA